MTPVIGWRMRERGFAGLVAQIVGQQVSIAGADEAEWSADGRSIYYSWFGKLYRVGVNPATGEVGKPELLRRVQVPLGWTVARDGRVLVGRLQKGHVRRSVKVILNWASTLDANN